MLEEKLLQVENSFQKITAEKKFWAENCFQEIMFLEKIRTWKLLSKYI